MKRTNNNFRKGSGVNRRSFWRALVVLLLLVLAGQVNAGIITVQSTGTIPFGEYGGETVTFHATFSDDLVNIYPTDEFTVYQDNEGTIEVSGPAGTVSWTGVQIHISDNYHSGDEEDFIGITTLDSGSSAYMYVHASTSFFEGVDLENVYNINQFSEAVGCYGSIKGEGSGTVAQKDKTAVINSATVVPEPMTLMLMATGAGLLLRKKRRKL